jgi:2-polyprenyl-6-hydroxyphenyl methylase/3-demethylubiquinone-9 3-methyltransferase
MAARYDFGRNWAALAAQLGEEHVAQACADLRWLVGDIAGRSFLDIGCGSGLHSVAALRLGAKRVLAVDYDSRCVEVARAKLRRFAPAGDWEVRRADVLAPASLPTGHFDHHTGAMWRAVANAAKRVAPGGRFFVALYSSNAAIPSAEFWLEVRQRYHHSSRRRPAGPAAL